MALSSGFFDAQNRDRVYTAEDFTSYLSSLICNGVLDTYGQCFKVTATNSSSVTIGTGKAWINGHYLNNTASYNLDLSSYIDPSANRYVLIGICCDTSSDVRQCSLVVKEGAAAAVPSLPSFSSFGQQTYLTLAAVYLSAGSSIITAADITDFREDERRCGYVKCILGKCGITDLETRLKELEERAAIVERILGLDNRSHRLLRFSTAATGMVSVVGRMDKSMNGLIGTIGMLDTVKIEEDK